MITLNANSWFVRKYLGCNSRNLPNGICDLAWTFVGRTLFFVLIICVSLLLIGAIVNAIRFGYNIDALTEYYGSEELAHMSVAASIIVYAVLTIRGFLHFFGEKINDWMERRNTEYFNEMYEMCNKLYYNNISREEYDAWYETSKYNTGFFKTVGQVISALWKRVHDKTCVMIDWKHKS